MPTNTPTIDALAMMHSPVHTHHRLVANGNQHRFWKGQLMKCSEILRDEQQTMSILVQSLLTSNTHRIHSLQAFT